jgi:hypothetical protein
VNLSDYSSLCFECPAFQEHSVADSHKWPIRAIVINRPSLPSVAAAGDRRRFRYRPGGRTIDSHAFRAIGKLNPATQSARVVIA